MSDVLIVGAGIGGLTLAYELEKLGQTVTVIEASEQVGGVIKSSIVNGCQIENGPNTLTLSPEIKQLVSELELSSELLLASPTAKKRYLGVRQTLSPLKLVAAPSSFLEFLLTPILSVAAKIRIFSDLYKRPTKEDDLSVYSFFYRHFGREVAENLVSAVLNGIYAPDIKKLSARSCLSKFWQADQSKGSVIRGLLANKTKRGPVCSFNGGLEILPRALASGLSDLRLETKVESLSPSDGEVTVRLSKGVALEEEVIRVKKVIITSERDSAAKLVSNIDKGISSLISEIPHSPIGILNLKVPTSSIRHSSDGFGFLIPPKDGYPVLGCIFSSSIFPERCESGTTLLTVFSGGVHSPTLANVEIEEIKAKVIKEIKNLLTISAEVEVLSAKHWSSAIANYPLGHYKTQEAVSQFEERLPSIKLLAAWLDGVSLPDRVKLSLNLARDLSSELSEELTNLKKEANG